jgi:hypothetical protein
MPPAPVTCHARAIDPEHADFGEIARETWARSWSALSADGGGWDYPIGEPTIRPDSTLHACTVALSLWHSGTVAPCPWHPGPLSGMSDQ